MAEVIIPCGDMLKTIEDNLEDRSGKHLEPPSLCQNDIDIEWAYARKRDEPHRAEIIAVCNVVCCYIKDKYSVDILHVWPAYDSTDKDHVQFIITTKDISYSYDFDLKYSIVLRQANKYSNEAKVAMECIENKKIKLSFEDSEKIKLVINSRAEELLKTHRNLSVISGSAVRSRGYSQGKHELIQEICIVLYVQTKGKIPLDETEFPKELDGIPVDVMEGEFLTCAPSGGFQPNLRMGSKIESIHGSGYGTLGGFIEHPEYGLSAITCAHVVLNNTELHNLQRDGKTTWNNDTNYVYQPDQRDLPNNYFGQIKKAIYNSGGKGQAGVDLAVVQIKRRPPIDGQFPDQTTVSTVRETLNFETGKVRSCLNFDNSLVWKFGCESEVTRGNVTFSGDAVQLVELEHRYRLPDGDHTYRLFNQLEIRSGFVERGDSGSLVFIKDVSGDLVCIGMVVGGVLPIGYGIVTPISAILSELGVDGFKDFRLNKINAIENRLRRIENILSSY